jgi:hypothetical protein
VVKWIRRFNEAGLGGLQERPGRGRKRRLQETDALAVVETTLATPQWLHLGFTVWSVRRLRSYLLETGRFAALGVGTLYAILRGADLVIRQCRSWFGRFGQSKALDKEEFARRKADVTAQYGPLPEGEVTVCVDGKRVYHRPEPGSCWQHAEVAGQRRARYSKSGTRTDILGALGFRVGKVLLECTECADGAAVARFLARVVKAFVAAGFHLIHLVLDNASVNTAALKEAVLAPWLKHMQVHWTPTHASWLNLAEPFWSSFHRAVIATSYFRTHLEVVEATAAFEVYWLAHPREFHWPKQPRKKRRSTPLPTWARLLTIPINSWTLN